MLWTFCSLSPFVRQYVIVIAVNLSVLGAGIGFAWGSPVLVKLAEENNPVIGRPIADNEASWLISIVGVSCILSTFLASYLVDRIGRKNTFILTAIPRIVAYLLLYLATNVRMLMIGRFLVGWADGMMFIVIPMYSTEISSKEIRGALGIVFQLSSTLGIVFMFSIGPFISYYALTATCLGIVIASSVPLVFLPDSPYFLNKKGRKEEAKKVLTSLRGSKSLVDEELSEYNESDKNESSITLKEVFQSRSILKAIGISIGIGTGLQLSGYNAVTGYMQTILDSTDTNVSSRISSVIIGFIQLLACFFAAFIVQRAGRRPILITSLFGVAAGMLGLGTFFTLADNDVKISGFLNYVPLISLILIIFCYSYGVGALAFLVMSELFEGRARALGMLSGMLCNMAGLLVITRAFSPMTKTLGPAVTFLIFAANCVLYGLFIVFCVPETRGRTFAEIQQKLGEREVKNEVTVIEKF